MAESGEDYLSELLIEFTACVGEALLDICTYSLIAGDAYVPFNPDEDEDGGEACEENLCSQVWVRVTGVQAISSPSFSGEDCSATLSIGLEVGVIRCIEIEEGGEAPDASTSLAAALQSISDMTKLYCAAVACPADWDLASVDWTPFGPLGGQYGGMWNFTAQV